ncbi:site-specific DNA-methyltransferase [Candidatus Poribacteria bacterium]|nr:site-specific DNA-methyltransferase [Candidatus Poribacteria bacterium]MYF54208.1 site-specific DNA-methyltransferase [Candidatus Poribacteria bacterium]MYI93137.1 site-specific DNA-methyltransferase [Candidatus Poribacteria bacterium]
MPTLEFNGKHHIYTYHFTVPYRPLETDENRSCNPTGEDDNLIIDSDNLHALKALLPRYKNRIKCIYIDPPYNTGKEGWVYNDNVNSPLMQEWLKENGPVDEEDLERHEKWLCMMWPRLHLLKELLAEDGVIFISIDDNEVHHLRMLMNEIFTEGNFRNLISLRRGVKNVQAQFEYVDRLNVGSEYILFYSKSPDLKFHHLTVDIDEKKIGTWNNHWRGTNRPTMRYELMGITPETGQWRWEKERSLTAIENYERLLDECGSDPTQTDIDEWWFAQSPQKTDLLRMSSTNRPEHFVPPSDRRIISSLWTDMIVNESSSLMKTLGIEFPNPKRTDLIKRIIDYATINDENAVILDSFAGSGTTAHAVLALNKEDGGNRKFILIECEDYADTITAERVRSVINGVPNASDASLQEGLGGSFAYCTLGEPLEIEGMLTGKNLPTYTALATNLLFTSAGISIEDDALDQKNNDGLFYSDDKNDYYLIYKQDFDYLRSNEAILSMEHAKRIEDSSNKNGKKAIVYAAGNYIGQRELTKMGIAFCQLPYCIHER